MLLSLALQLKDSNILVIFLGSLFGLMQLGVTIPLELEAY